MKRVIEWNRPERPVGRTVPADSELIYTSKCGSYRIVKRMVMASNGNNGCFTQPEYTLTVNATKESMPFERLSLAKDSAEMDFDPSWEPE